MRPCSLRALSEQQLEQLAEATLVASREHAPEWLPDLDAAREELADAREPGQVSCVIVTDSGQPIAWAAASHQYGRVWELHPLVVAVDHQRRGHGRRLAELIEVAASAHGALTLWLGTSDETGATSLSGVDLWSDPLAALAAMEVRSSHAVMFWQRVGYRLTGIVPDAERPGVPSICLAKSVATALQVRREREADADQVGALVSDAFSTSDLGYSGEAELVARLRAACPELVSLVAEAHGRVVGHIAFSTAVIGDGDAAVHGMGLGPMAVAPSHQGLGIGVRLVAHGLSELRERGCAFSIVIGHPGYYPRFGFRRASDLGVHCEVPGVPDDAFMINVLDDSQRQRIRGTARYHPEFGLG